MRNSDYLYLTSDKDNLKFIAKYRVSDTQSRLGIKLQIQFDILRRSNATFPFCFRARSQNCEKRLLSIVMSVRPSVRMEQLGSHLTDFHEI